MLHEEEDTGRWPATFGSPKTTATIFFAVEQACTGLFACPGDEGPDGGTVELRQRWRVERRYTDGDSWGLWVAALAAAQVALHEEDVPHTGCCKAYALVLLLQPEYAHLGAATSPQWPKKPEVYAHVLTLRALLPPALDDAELALLRSPANANRSGYTAATSLEDAKRRVAVPFDRGRALGYSMSPVWLEEFETSVVCAHHRVACIELHSACTSNCGRSHVQVVLPAGCPAPAPGKPLVLRDDTEVVFLRRIACHYHAVWINGRARTPVRELPSAVRSFLGI
jgi:hypothetical protein